MRNTIAGMVGAFLAAAAGAGTMGGQSATPWELVPHEIATGLRGGYQVVAVDMNKDRRVDLLAVATSATADLIWFENPTWTRHVVASGLPAMINADAFDIDNDGIPEIALASGFATAPARSAGVMTLLTHGADVTAPWSAKEFDRAPTAHRLRWIDADGTGRNVLINAPLAGVNGVAPDYRDKVSIYAYKTGDLARTTVTDAEEGVIHGLAVADWDGKGRQSLLTASFLGIHLHRFAGGQWRRTRLTPGNAEAWPRNGSSDVAVLKTPGGRQLAAIEPWHGNQVVIYRGSGDTWNQRTTIDDSLTDGHTLVAGDLDGDGVDEVVAGFRGGGGGVNIYRMGAKDAWTRTELDHKGMAAAGCALAHLNDDTRLDLACIGTSTANLKWYENRSAR
jgi:hypothetical protein